MKKLLTTLICMVICMTMALSLSACSQVPEIGGTLEEIMQKIYDGAEVTNQYFVYNTVVNEENRKGYLGTDDVSFLEGIASEPMISTLPHSIVLIRVENGSNIEAAKKLIKDNADPRKWICVGVDEENVVVDNIGNLIVLIMSNDSAAFHASFKALANT